MTECLPSISSSLDHNVQPSLALRLHQVRLDIPVATTETRSLKAMNILQHWDVEKANFLQVCPKEMLIHLPAPLGVEEAAVPAE